MAQLTRCDRCGNTDDLCEQLIVRGVRVDVCPSCMDALFDPWLQTVLDRVGTVAQPTVPTRADPWPRAPQHGFMAAAIEAASSPPAPVVATGGGEVVTPATKARGSVKP